MCLICQKPGSPLGGYLLSCRKRALLLRNDCALPEASSAAWAVMLSPARSSPKVGVLYYETRALRQSAYVSRGTGN
ncbi:hypothetical protein CDL15_Pgr024826 [Punica granatum]|uniref:Uncharacterized protein n=1 Tax=Punica granatum TaxID=22663 RepID=A0A218WIV1_PUNGR|nr:hypothetical protein CDL15_Pgr024826 [Punica granatum]